MFTAIVWSFVIAGADPNLVDVKSSLASAVSVECVRYSRDGEFRFTLTSSDDIAAVVKRFNPAKKVKPFPGNSRIIHRWIVRWEGKDGRKNVFTLFGEDKVRLEPDGAWLGELLTNDLHRFLTDRATELGSPDPLIPSLPLKPQRSEQTFAKTEALGRSWKGHVQLQIGGNDVIVAEDATDYLLIYNRGSDGGGFRRSQVFQSAILDHDRKIEKAVPQDHMRGAFALAQSPDGLNLYLACDVSSSVCVFRRKPDDRLAHRWECVQVCLDKKEGVVGLQRPREIAVTPDGLDVYIGSGAQTLVGFRRDLKTGKLTPSFVLREPQEALQLAGAPFGFLRSPMGMVTSPNGRWVYAIDFGGHAILRFERDADSGSLICRGFDRDELKDGHFLPKDRGVMMPMSLSMSDDGKNLYICSARGTLSNWKPDPETGKLEFIEVHHQGRDGVSGMDYAVEVTAVPKTNRVIVVGKNSHGFAQFERQPNGRLKFLIAHTSQPDAKHSFAYPWSVAVSPDLRFFYVASEANTLTMLGLENDPLLDRQGEPK